MAESRLLINPIPLPWKSPDQNSDETNPEAPNEQQQPKKRGIEEKDLAGKDKRRKLSPREFNGNSNESSAFENLEGREGDIQLITDITDISSPGTPMAQSTPMMAGGSSSARSAFSVLQQPVFAHQPHHQSHQQHFMPSAPPTSHGYGYYPPPPPMEPMHMFPALYNPWMRWPTGPMIPQPPLLFGMKMEPMEELMRDNGTYVMGMKIQGGKKTATGKTGQKKKVDGEQQQQQHQDDSGMGQDETTESNIRRGSIGGHETISLPIPPPMIPLHPINSYETYCTVPGRLTLLSNMKKYRVSIAEIQRRLSPPECLNASILGGILRKAKNKDGGRLLREQLLTYGVELTTGRRKQGPLTCFSSMVEEEAAQLAYDFRTISQNSYPINAAAAFALTDVHNAQDASAHRLELYYSSKLLNRILDFHKADRSPNVEQFKQDPEQIAELDSQLQAGLTKFSLLTHGFGGRTVQSVLESILSVINESNGVLNRNYPETAGQMATPMPFNF